MWDGCGHEKLKRESLRILRNDFGFLLREVCGLLTETQTEAGTGLGLPVIDA